jgi:hypothetical protein
MADNFKYVQCQPFYLYGAGASVGDATIVLTSMEDVDEVLLTMTDFGTVGYGTLEPGSGTNEEQISFTGITQNANGTATLTGVKTVLMKAPYTETANLAKTHAGGTAFVISNTAGFYNKFTSKDDDESIAGIYTFAQFPVGPSSAPTTDYQMANKKYADDLAIAGAPDMSTSVKGIAQEATQAQIDAGTQTGSTGAQLAVNPKYLKDSIYYTQLPSSDQKAALAGTGTPSAANKFVTADTDALKQTLANLDTTVTLGGSDTKYPSQNAVKTYVDNTPASYKNGATTYDISTASGTQTIAHGLGRTPKMVRIRALFAAVSLAAGGAQFISETVYNGTTQSSQSVYGSNTNVLTADGTNFRLGTDISGPNTNYATGVITVDGTNINIAWTKTSSATGVYQILWQVQ